MEAERIKTAVKLMQDGDKAWVNVAEWGEVVALTDIDLTDLLHDQRSSQKGLFKKPDWDIAGQSYERAGKWQIYSRLRASLAVNVQYSTQQLPLRLGNRTSSQSKPTQKRPRLCSRQMRKCFFARYSLVSIIFQLMAGWSGHTWLAKPWRAQL